MNALSVIFLGIIQGLTEFLPVSSSGHLVLAKQLFPSISSPGALLETILHIGTALAILVYFRKGLLNWIIESWRLIIIASIPAALVGILFQGFIENFFSNTRIVGVALLVTAAINYLIDKASSRRSKIILFDALSIGLAQAIAIIPGISRSGATILAGTRSGVRAQEVAEFSFILSVPAILGASILELTSHGIGGVVPIIYLLFGLISAFITGIIAIHVVIRLLSEKRFLIFSAYCLILGVIALLI